MAVDLGAGGLTGAAVTAAEGDDGVAGAAGSGNAIMVGADACGAMTVTGAAALPSSARKRRAMADAVAASESAERGTMSLYMHHTLVNHSADFKGCSA